MLLVNSGDWGNNYLPSTGWILEIVDSKQIKNITMTPNNGAVGVVLQFLCVVAYAHKCAYSKDVKYGQEGEITLQVLIFI